MDPITFGIGAVVGIFTDRMADVLSRRFLWSDKSRAVHEVYLTQLKDTMDREVHQKLVTRLDARIGREYARYESARKRGQLERAARLGKRVETLEARRDAVTAGALPATEAASAAS